MSRSQAAREAVVAYEHGASSEETILSGCDWSFAQLQDPLAFVDGMYGSVRRVESAAWKQQWKKHPLVQSAARTASTTLPSLGAMLQRVDTLMPTTPLEEAGKEFLLDRLRWGISILTTSLPTWGY